MARTLEVQLRRWREKLRVEGPDGEGFSDPFMIKSADDAVQDLAEVFPIQDTFTFPIAAVARTYDLQVKAGTEVIEAIAAVFYNTLKLVYLQPKEYFALVTLDEGDVTRYTIWGTTLYLVGLVVNADTITIWFTRTPNHITAKGHIPETPEFADPAIEAWVLAECCEEDKMFDRAAYYRNRYRELKISLANRKIPQMQKDSQPSMNNSDYYGPVDRKGFSR